MARDPWDMSYFCGRFTAAIMQYGAALVIKNRKP